MSGNTQDALAGLRKWKLRRDDETDSGGRLYWDDQGNRYYSVTRILSATAPQHQRDALERWLARPDAEAERQQAAMRGTKAHEHAEYILKTARKISYHAANKRGAWSKGRSDGLVCPPKSLTAYGIDKAIQGAPRPAWSAAGYARGLRHWIEANVTAIHAVEFSIHHPAGFAGTCDGLLDISGTLTVCDWKTTKKSIHGDMSAILDGYKAQLGAYSLGLKHLTGIQAPSAAIVLARRTGAPSVTMLSGEQLRLAEDAFLERCQTYFLTQPSVANAPSVCRPNERSE